MINSCENIEEKHYDSVWNSIIQSNIDSDNLGCHFSSVNPRMEIVKIVNKYNFNKDINILDVGCGLGRNSIWLAQEGYKVTAIDLSSIAINYLKRQINREIQIKEKLLVQKISFLDFHSSHKYQFVIDDGCFHHIHPIFRNEYISKLNCIIDKNSYYCLICFNDKHCLFEKYQNRGIDNIHYAENKHISIFYSKDEILNIYSSFLNLVHYDEIHGLKGEMLHLFLFKNENI